MNEKCVYHREKQKITVRDYCRFFNKKCGDQNFDCKPIFRQCEKCGSANIKYIKTVTPCFNEIGDEFKCEDCGDIFYRWA